MFIFCQHVVLIIWITYFTTEHSFAYSYDNTTLLKSALLNGYDSDLIPVNNQTKSLNLTLGMTIYKILDVDIVRGTMTLTLSLQCSWFDEKMTWTPSDYGGVTSVMIQASRVWTPPLIISNPVEFTLFGKNWMHVIYQSNGFAFWGPGGVTDLTCWMDLKYWPFDEQTCDISFIPYDYWAGQIRYFSSDVIMSFYQENGEWEVVKAESSLLSVYEMAEIAVTKLTLRRRPLFYILTLVLPLFILELLSNFVYLLPSESGERVSYTITTLLALTVFLTIVSDNVPNTSNPVPHLCVYIFAGVVMNSLTSFIVILNVALYHRHPDKKIGSWYITFVNTLGCKPYKVDEGTFVEEFNQTGKLDGKVDQHSEHVNQEPDLIEREKRNLDITWKDVSNAIDTTMFVVMTLVHVLLIIVWTSLMFME